MNQLRDWVFNKVHTKNLVYNTCWEDPRCDRELLDFQEDSNVVMITSAGCNALDYLLDLPAQINCIDVNPRQNALLRLKLSTFYNTDFDTLFKLFGTGSDSKADAVYFDALRTYLPDYAQKFWDNNLHFFNGKGLRKSFYHYGTSGTFAWMANKYLKTRKKLYGSIHEMFETQDLAEQSKIYEEIEPKLGNKLVAWFVNRHLTMSLLGVPRSQQELFIDEYKQGALGYVKECLGKVFTQLPTTDNYFWRLYIYGNYTKECCPSYLKEENFKTIKDNTERVRTHTTTISNFLKENPGTYSHYVLLDHQDWLAANNIPALEEEWEQILKNSQSGTKILLRSAAKEVDFFPQFVLDAVDFEKDITAKTHKEDRVGTYASVYMAVVK